MTLSPTILRVLAGVFHVLAVDLTDERNARISPEGYEQAVDLFGKLSTKVQFPLDAGWLRTGYFAEGAKAPGSRAQDLKGLTTTIVEWGRDGVVLP